MTIHGGVQQLLESADFEPKECIHETPTHGTPLLSGTGPIAVISSLTCQMHRLFPLYTDQPDGRMAPNVAAVDADDYREVEGKSEGKVGTPTADWKKQYAVVVTIDDIYARVAKSIRDRCLTTQRVTEYLLVADKRKWVPVQKRATQELRATHTEPYPPGTVVHGNGLLVENEEVGIQLERLMMTRELREPLYLQLQQRMPADLQLRPFNILCDLTHEAPVLFHQGQQRPVVKSEIRSIGEDDVTMVIHARQLRETHAIFLDSVDRDSLAILLLQHRSFRTNDLVLWFGDGRYIRPMEMADKLISVGWTVLLWIELMALCGCDYVDKGLISHGLGVPQLFAAGMAFLRARPDSVDLVQNKRDFRLWIRILYAHHYASQTKGDLDSIPSLANLRALYEDKGWKRWAVPSNEDIDTAYKQLRWVTLYWSSLSGSLFTFEGM